MGKKQQVKDLNRDILIHKAIELRTQGTDLRTIAKELGVVPNTIRAWIEEYRQRLQDINIHNTQDIRNKQLNEINTMKKSVWQGAVKGDIPSIKTMLALTQEEAKLTGTYALEEKVPERPAVNINMGFAPRPEDKKEE